MRHTLFLISAIVAFTAQSDEPKTSAPKIDIDQAIALAGVKPNPKVLYCRSAVLTSEPDRGLVWIVEYEIEQPSPPPADTLKLSRLVTWVYRVRIDMNGKDNGGYLAANYKANAPHNLSTGIPIPGKKGFCSTPYGNGAAASYIDVRGAQPGEIVQCPYTGLPLVVPQPSRD